MVYNTNHNGQMARKVNQAKAMKIINDQDNMDVFVFSTTSNFEWTNEIVPVKEGTTSKLFRESVNVRPWSITKVDIILKFQGSKFQYIKLKIV